MSHISNDAPIQNEPINSDTRTPTGVMLMTMTLLIGTLTLTSAMLLHYAAKKNPAAKTAFDEKTSMLSTLTSKFKSEPAKEKNPKSTEPSAEKTSTKKEASGGIKSLFGGNGNAKVRWPKLKLAGFGSSTDGAGGFAIINGRKYHPGQLINKNVKLIAIHDYCVEVECQGETRTLTVDIKQD